MVLEHRYKDVTLCFELGGNMSRQAMHFIFLEEENARKTLCMDKKTCSCVQTRSFSNTHGDWETRETRFHPKKPTNQENPVLCDTPVKTNEEFEDVVKHLDDLISLDEIWHFLVSVHPFFGRYAPTYFLGYIM